MKRTRFHKRTAAACALALLLSLCPTARAASGFRDVPANHWAYQAIVDAAVADADSIRQGSIGYTDDMLKNLQGIIAHSMEEAQGRLEAYLSSLQSAYEVVSANRDELAAGMAMPQEEGQG